MSLLNRQLYYYLLLCVSLKCERVISIVVRRVPKEKATQRVENAFRAKRLAPSHLPKAVLCDSGQTGQASKRPVGLQLPGAAGSLYVVEWALCAGPTMMRSALWRRTPASPPRDLEYIGEDQER